MRPRDPLVELGDLRVARFALACLVLASSFAGLPARGAVTRQIGLEEAVDASEVIVVATVVENPEDATIVSGGTPCRRQRVHVERYLDGAGPADLVVLSPGGKTTAWIPGVGVRPIEILDGSDGRLPPEGTEAVLFLRRQGDAFRLASLTHGIVPVTVDRASGRKSVDLLFDDFRNLGPAGRASTKNLDLRRMQTESAASGRLPLPSAGNEKFADTVDVDSLARTIRTLRAGRDRQRETP